MKSLSAVLVETGKPLELVELEIPPLKAGQTLVEIEFSGVCHTQVLECRGYRGEDRYLPHCLGHEGAGMVREVGPGVNKVKLDDRVVLSWIKGAGMDVPGTVYRWNGKKVNAGAVTTFAHYAVISENRLTVLPDDLPMRDAALLGCAIPTGLGTVFNTAHPTPGQSMAIFGIGGIGLCALAGAAISGCVPIIAIDIFDNKLQLAQEIGATHGLNSKICNPVEEILRICPGGVDFAIEATGLPAVMQQAMLSVRIQGGTAIVVGNAHYGQYLQIDPFQLNLGKRLLGTWGGDSQPERDYLRYARLLSSDKLNVQPLISNNYSLYQINQAIDDLEAGRAVRPIIDLTHNSSK